MCARALIRWPVQGWCQRLPPDPHRLLAGRDAVDHLLQRHAFQEGRDLVAQRVPQPVRQAALAGHAGLGHLAAAAGHADVFLDGGHDLGDGDGAGRPSQAVAAGASARALHQSGTPQLEEQLLQVGQRDLLALGDRRQRQGALGAILGQIGHGRDGVPAARVQLHDACLQPTLRLDEFGCTCFCYPCPCYETRALRAVRGTRVQHTGDPSALSNCSNSTDIWKFRAHESSIFGARARVCKPSTLALPAKRAGGPRKP